MADLKFNIKKRLKCGARTGTLKLKHGTIQTPAFMPVATRASVKALSSEDLKKLGTQMLIANTYHLMLQPGAETIQKFGGLHKFMNWKKPIVTDSGGFQAFSLGLGKEHAIGKMAVIFPDETKNQSAGKKPEKSIVQITNKGVHFRSVYDNSKQFLSPEKSIKVQEMLGADMILVLDECTSPLSSKDYVEKSLERTHTWAKQCIDAHKTKQALVGIIQGGHWKDLREKSAKFIGSHDFDSIAIGGSLGKSKKDMHNILDWTIPHLPEDKPRHLLGIGVVEDIFEAVERGVDLFDCVTPTRMARSGYVYVRPPLGTKKNKYRYNIKRVRFMDNQPIDKNCDCWVCKTYSRGYINHLYKTQELLFHRLTSYHNIYFFMRLMREIRESIEKKKFLRFRKYWNS